MVIRLLGDVEIAHRDQWQRAGPAKQAGVLAALALSAGETVRHETLIHRTWGSSPPDSARNALYVYVAGLRRQLKEHESVALERRSEGYCLRIAPSDIDVFAMRGLVATAQERHNTDLDAAVENYRQATRMWSPRPLANLDGAWAERVRNGLRRERLGMFEARFDAELAAGNHSEVLEDLAAAVESDPQAEGLVGQFMLALYRAGQQSEALAVFARTERFLGERFGIDPGPALRQTHRRVLRQESTINEPQDAEPNVPRQVPRVMTSFVGRGDSVAQLNAVLAESDTVASQLTVVTGMPGVGKSALIVRWGQRVAAQFPDGQLFTNLRGSSPPNRLEPSTVLASMLRALGVPAAELPPDYAARLAMYRTLTADRRLLVMFDDAAEVAQVRPLLPAGPGCVVVVTSRQSLAGLVALEGAKPIELGALSSDDSVTLLRQFLPDTDTATLTEMTRWCGRLPLALRIAAANAAVSGSAERFLETARAQGRLTSLTVDDDPNVALRNAFRSTYEALRQEAQRVFRLLVTASTVDISSAAAAAMSRDSLDETEDVLRELGAAHLVVPVGEHRYTFHELVREFGRELAEQYTGDTAGGISRLRQWYVASARAAAETLSPHTLRLPIGSTFEVAARSFQDADAALDWFRAEDANLAVMVQHAAAEEHPAAYQLTEAWGLAAPRASGQSVLRESASQGLSTAIAREDADGEDVMRCLLSMDSPGTYPQ